jgi:hypothetical protein
MHEVKALWVEIIHVCAKPHLLLVVRGQTSSCGCQKRCENQAILAPWNKKQYITLFAMSLYGCAVLL